MNNPRGINYQTDKELRENIAEEIRKFQNKQVDQSAVQAGEKWPSYVESIVERLKAEKLSKKQGEIT